MKRDEIYSIFQSGIEAVNPYKLVLQAINLNDNNLNIGGVFYDLNRFEDIVVVGAGKATSPMAQAVEKILGNRISKGLIVVKYGHTYPLQRIAQIEAGHPVPDEAGVKGTEEIIRLLKDADDKTFVVCFLSGGASSLLVSPVEGITIKEKQKVTELLLLSGAQVEELNTIRKHLSNVKGGRLAELTYPATVVTLILSDVIGNRIDVIASGPTVPDTTTFQDAMGVIERYSLKDKLPVSAKRLLEKGIEGEIQDAPKGAEPFFKKDRAIIIGSIKDAISASADIASSMGFEPEIITSELQGEARNAGRYLAARAIEVQNSMGHRDKPRCLISGGETTVTVKGKGLGGRNQELALSFAIEIEGIKGITMLSAATDGTDGQTDAAGAIVDGETVPLARKFGLDPSVFLEANDSYNFFKKLDSLSKEKYHLITGPTGTNVMDMQIMVVEG